MPTSALLLRHASIIAEQTQFKILAEDAEGMAEIAEEEPELWKAIQEALEVQNSQFKLLSAEIDRRVPVPTDGR